MLRRLLVRPRVLLPILAWAVALGFLPRVGDAAPLPPATSAAADADRDALETRLVVARLVALGVSPEDATARLATLPEAERHALAERIDEVEAGGSAAGAVAIVIIIGLLVVLILELMGRRVISRP